MSESRKTLQPLQIFLFAFFLINAREHYFRVAEEKFSIRTLTIRLSRVTLFSRRPGVRIPETEASRSNFVFNAVNEMRKKEEEAKKELGLPEDGFSDAGV